jgi:MscS family membrane protein
MSRHNGWPALLAILVMILTPGGASAQSTEEATPERTRMRDLLENERRADELFATADEMQVPVGEPARTPLQLMVLLSRAIRAGDLEHAAGYLDRRYLPEETAAYPATDLVAALRIVWNQQNIVDISRLSNQPEGRLDDDLPDYRELLGVVTKDDGEKVPIYLQRIPDGAGGQEWKISNASVARIPELWQDLGYGPLGVWLQRTLPDYEFAGLQSWQLIAGALFLLVSWPLAGLASALLGRLVLLVARGYPTAVGNFFRLPMRVFLFLMIFRALMDQLALSLAARIYLNSSGIDYLAVTIIILGLVSVFRDYQTRRMERAGNRHLVALLRPFTTIVKFLVVIAVALVWADRAGYNMSTILAGLGVGSLAVALAAQKTLENLIGAVTLYAARPVNPGDLCRFGKIVGVVEEIGLRSTLIRTLDRTLLAVPNSMFAAVEVENFSHRDRIRYYRHIELQMTTANQLRVILGRLRTLFLSHADVLQETVSVRLEKIVAATAVIRIDAGIDTRDYQRFLAVAEDLNLRLIELVHEAGAVFSGPGQVLQLRDFQQASAEQMTAVETQLAAWQIDGGGPFPDLAEAEKHALRGRIELPARSADS